MIDAERCTPGGIVKVETYSAAGGRWTEAYYVPTAADLAALDRLEPGCPPDRVPWERFRAELIAAPAALLPQRDWQRAPAASLLMMLEALRRRMADDEAASRGIGEPEAPQATPARTSPKRKATEPSEARILAGKLLIEAWNQSGNGTKPFDGYAELIRTAKQRHGVDISKSNLTNAQRDLGELAEPIRRWVNPRRLSPATPDDPKATPGEVEDCKTWFMLRREYQQAAVFERINALTPEAWRALAAQPVEHWETCLKSMVKESGAGIR